MRFKNIILSMFLTLTALNCFAEAEGGTSGGGGDPYCAQYSDLAGIIATELVKIGQSEISAINPNINAAKIWDIKKSLKCIPVGIQNRMAITYDYKNGSYVTTLITQKWKNLNFSDQLRLTVHELAIAAGYENDGEYHTSEDLLKILKLKSKFFIYRSKAQFAQENSDGTVYFNSPYFFAVGKSHRFTFRFQDMFSYVNGVCKFLGLNESVDVSITDGQFTSVNLASVNNAGQITKTRTIDSNSQDKVLVNYIDSITCK